MLIPHQDIDVGLDVVVDDLVLDLAVWIDGGKGLGCPVPAVLLVILGHRVVLVLVSGEGQQRNFIPGLALQQPAISFL